MLFRTRVAQGFIYDPGRRVSEFLIQLLRADVGPPIPLYAGTPSLVKRSPSHSKRLDLHVDSERGDQGCDVSSSFAFSVIDSLSRGHHGPRKGILICFGFYL